MLLAKPRIKVKVRAGQNSAKLKTKTINVEKAEVVFVEGAGQCFRCVAGHDDALCSALPCMRGGRLDGKVGLWVLKTD